MRIHAMAGVGYASITRNEPTVPISIPYVQISELFL